jgi:hypothetical protein
MFVRFVVMSQAKGYQINVQSVEQQKINLKLLEVEITQGGFGVGPQQHIDIIYKTIKYCVK